MRPAAAACVLQQTHAEQKATDGAPTEDQITLRGERSILGKT